MLITSELQGVGSIDINQTRLHCIRPDQITDLGKRSKVIAAPEGIRTSYDCVGATSRRRRTRGESIASGMLAKGRRVRGCAEQNGLGEGTICRLRRLQAFKP